jgi:hypothetical protein
MTEEGALLYFLLVLFSKESSVDEIHGIAWLKRFKSNSASLIELVISTSGSSLDYRAVERYQFETTFVSILTHRSYFFEGIIVYFIWHASKISDIGGHWDWFMRPATPPREQSTAGSRRNTRSYSCVSWSSGWSRVVLVEISPIKLRTHTETKSFRFTRYLLTAT